MVGGSISVNRSSDAPASSSACEHVGVAVAQQVAQPGEEGVAVPDLWGAAPIPLEGLVRIVGQRRGVALEDDDLVISPSQRDRGTQPGDAGSHHHDPRHPGHRTGNLTARSSSRWHSAVASADRACLT